MYLDSNGIWRKNFEIHKVFEPITYAVTTGVLPTGLSLSSAGVISGTPTVLGSFSGTVTASNGTAPAATQNFTIVIGTPPTITSAAPVNGPINVAYNHTYSASGTATITFAVTSGALPTGLSLSTAGVAKPFSRVSETF